VPQLVKAYASVPIGNPLLPGTLMGPLHNAAAVKVFADTVAAATAQGGKVGRAAVALLRLRCSM